MDEARIAELLKPFLDDSDGDRGSVSSEKTELSGVQLRHISIYIDLLLRWNARINLTAVRTPEEIVTRHFGESLFAARHLFPKVSYEAAGSQISEANPHVIDIGSGAGFPGLPIKIWAQHVDLTLIEANHKKATFLREVGRTLGLATFEVFAGRADAYAGSEGDVVTLRAVERFEAILPLAEGLTAPSGGLALLVGRSQFRAIHAVRGIKWDEPIEMPLSSTRVLVIGRKESDKLTD
jgi:16S rRNA (guanine527-N7)-methyltransferase